MKTTEGELQKKESRCRETHWVFFHGVGDSSTGLFGCVSMTEEQFDSFVEIAESEQDHG